MEGLRPRLEIVLRRWGMDYKYSSLGSPVWTPFEDSEYSEEKGESICSRRPENRRFEVLGDREIAKGEIVVHTCQQNKFYRGSTPWGELEIRKAGLTTHEVLTGSATVGTLREGLSGAIATVAFPLGQEMRFKGRMLWYSNMMAQTESGSVSIIGERGQRSNPGPDQHRNLSRKAYKSLTDQQKKEVVETDQYNQWRISLQGLLPARDEDILGVLSMGICRNILCAEYIARTVG